MQEPLIVVFDVNIYLDAARLAGEPYAHTRLTDALISCRDVPPPHPDARIDSARALEIAKSGWLVHDTQPLQVWTSDHINALVRHKASQPDDPALIDEDRGLGWSMASAQLLLESAVWPVVAGSGGDSVGDLRIPERTPPLDHEDGLVMATVLAAADADIVCDKLLVTRDRRFVEVCASMTHPRVMHPARFVQMTRAARARVAIRRMR